MPTPTTAATTTTAEQPGGIQALGINAPVLITQVINFLILFLVLRWLLYRPVTELLDKRRAAIAEGVEAAARAKQELAAADATAAETVAKAKIEARTLIDQARMTAEQASAAIVARAEEQAVRTVDQAKQQADQERLAMRASLEQELGGLVVAAAGRIVEGQQLEVSGAQIADALKAVSR